MEIFKIIFYCPFIKTHSQNKNVIKGNNNNNDDEVVYKISPTDSSDNLSISQIFDLCPECNKPNTAVIKSLNDSSNINENFLSEVSKYIY